MAKINFESSALMLSLLCLVYILTAKGRQYRLSKSFRSNLMNQHFVFIAMLISTIVSSATSVSGYYLELVPFGGEKIVFWKYLLHALYYCFHNMLAICFALYIMHLNGSSAGRSRRFFILFSLPFLLCELIVLTNGFTGFAFYMDDNFVYHRGSLIMFIYLAGFFYFVLGFGFFFRYKRAMSPTDSRTIGILLGLTALGVIVQAINSKAAVELFSESLTFVGIMLMLEERSGHVDPVTGALNRIALLDECRKLTRTNQHFRIVLVKLTDIDNFATLFGGREMDRLLIMVSSWLTSISSDQNLFNYRSADFAIIYHGSDDKQAEDAVEMILKRFNHDWRADDAAFRLDAAVCVLRVPEDVRTLDEITEILTSGYRKHGMGPRRIPYDELFENQRNRKIEKALREAVDQHKLRVWYQPIWSVEAQRTIAAEALLRIDSEELKRLSPEVYIPIAEKCGIIREIGLFVFEDVCRFLKSTIQRDLGLKYIELNLSVHQFMYDDLVERFEVIRKQNGVPAEAINLEITESASTGDSPAVRQTMNELRNLGYTFSLDDFGTGYSNLMQFISSTYKNVKMDKQLLWDSENNEITAKLLDSMIQLLRSIGCDVVQEGVETADQLKRTEASGGNLIQGYYFSRPIPEYDFVSYLEKEKKKAVES